MKIKIFKWSGSWVIQCPHGRCSDNFPGLASTHREAISKAHKHLRARHATHRPYIAWLPITGTTVARCRDCSWHAITTPFSAAAQHLKESK